MLETVRVGISMMLAAMVLLIILIIKIIKKNSGIRLYKKYCVDFKQDNLLFQKQYLGRKYTLKKERFSRKIKNRIIVILLIGVVILCFLASYFWLTIWILEKSEMLYVLANIIVVPLLLVLLCVVMLFAGKIIFSIIGKINGAFGFFKIFATELLKIQKTKSSMRIVKVKKDGVKYE